MSYRKWTPYRYVNGKKEQLAVAGDFKFAKGVVDRDAENRSIQITWGQSLDVAVAIGPKDSRGFGQILYGVEHYEQS